MPIRRINADPVVLQMSYSPPFSQEELDQLDISLGITARATSVTGDDVDDDDIDDSETAQPVTPSAAPAKTVKDPIVPGDYRAEPCSLCLVNDEECCNQLGKPRAKSCASCASNRRRCTQPAPVLADVAVA